MIPQNKIALTELEFKEQPSKTYRMHFRDNVISGYCDKLEAVKQAIYKILSTERYEHSIYSWNYGIELRDLYGEANDYIYAELERRITEALLWDRRILSIEDFEFETLQKHSVHVSFTARTVFGTISLDKEVNI